MDAVRVSGQTRAFVSGLPVSVSQTTVVSRWFVMPIPAKEDMSFPWERNCFVALEIQVLTDWIISSGSCSSHLPKSVC